MLLTKHEGETFLNQTVYISGQAFVRCTFHACTLVLRETVYHLEGCSFERCNWHVDAVLLWGSPESLREVKGLIAMIEASQQQQQITGDAQRPGGMGMVGNVPPISSIPPIVGGAAARPGAQPPRISTIPPIVPRPPAGEASKENDKDKQPATT